MSDFADHLKATIADTDRLERDLDITNADHIALWLDANVIPHDALRLCLSWLSVQIVQAHERAIAVPTCPDCKGLGYIGGEDTPSSCMNKFHVSNKGR